MRILIIRHGDPDYSIDSLTEKGWREAHLLADRLCKEQIDKAYCSIYGRARDTAKETLERKNMTATYCDWLREIDYMRVTDPQNPENDRAMWDFMPEFFCNQPKMHSKDDWFNADIIKNTDIMQKYNNMCDNLDKVLSENGYERNGEMYNATDSNHKTIALFCHLGAESILLSHLLNTSPFIFLQYFSVAPTSVTTIFSEEREKGKVMFRAQSVGDVSHLYAGNEPIAFAARFCECFDDDTRH